MKMKLPSDLMGGLMIFGVAIVMFFVMRQFVKANQASIFSIFDAKSPQEFACRGVGGKWYPNADSNDPCCMLPKGVREIDVDGVPICLGRLP